MPFLYVDSQLEPVWWLPSYAGEQRPKWPRLVGLGHLYPRQGSGDGTAVHRKTGVTPAPLLDYGTKPATLVLMTDAQDKKAEKAEKAEKDNDVETVVVKSGRDDDRVAVFEQDETHPSGRITHPETGVEIGEAFVGPGDVVEAARTHVIEQRLSTGELVEASKKDVKDAKARDKEAHQPKE